jgi:hypothetical protein
MSGPAADHKLNGDACHRSIGRVEVHLGTKCPPLAQDAAVKKDVMRGLDPRIHQNKTWFNDGLPVIGERSDAVLRTAMPAMTGEH